MTTTFEASWESLKQYACPEWFRDAKFGIWAHWGPSSVAEYGDWYPRRMYLPENTAWYENYEPAYSYHCRKFGHPSECGFKDLIPLFKAEKWDPEALMDLYYRAGARYFMSMGQHHDNFDMWDSKHQPWNAVNMGPKRDIVGGWKRAASEKGMKFGISFHGEYTWRYFESTRLSDSSGDKAGIPYDGWLTREDGKGKWWEGYDPRDLYCRPHRPSEPVREIYPPYNGEPPDAEFFDRLSKRVIDALDKYHPDLIYFDGGLPNSDYGLPIAAYFYNQSQVWNQGLNQAALNIKGQPEDRYKAFVLDIENGRSESLKRYPWQTDTPLDGWFYMPGTGHLSTQDVVWALVDIVSKNGNLLLNITQRPDGTIRGYALHFLAEMEQWMNINGEAIHGTRPWDVFGEGPQNLENGEQNKFQRIDYTAEDIRFTTKDNNLYAILMSWPGRQVTVRSLSGRKKLWFGEIKQIQMLGVKTSLKWSQDEKGVTVQLPDSPPSPFANALKISGS